MQHRYYAIKNMGHHAHLKEDKQPVFSLTDVRAETRVKSESRTQKSSVAVLTAVKRKSMRNALVPGRRPRKFPAPKFN